MQKQGEREIDRRRPGSHCPAIWLYPDCAMDVEIDLKFHGHGFMTTSAPSYNDRWRIHVDPTQPFDRYSSTYVDDPWVPHLEYDGFRDGDFQETEGWCIEQRHLIEWQRIKLRELGFAESEIDEASFDYARTLLSRRYPERYFAVYPQQIDRVERSVALTVTPSPDTVYRLWLYFIPVDREPPKLRVPFVRKIERRGFTVVELAYLTEREIPPHLRSGTKRLLGHRAGRAVHRR